MDELVSEFLVETRESLDILDQELVELEQNPNDQALLGNIFRVVHTVKGTCGFLGLSRLEKVAHHGENVLGLYRDGVLEVTPESVTLILASLDRIKEIVDHIEQTGEEPEGDDSALIQKLEAITRLGENSEEEDDIFTPVPAAQTANVADSLGLSESSQVPQEEAEVEVEMPVAVAEPAVPAVKEEKEKTATQAKEVQAPVQSLRVNVDVLEDLMTMVSELVLTRNQLLQISRNYKETEKENEYDSPLQRLNHVVSELQEGVMKTRMQPIGNAWNKLPRIIRDLSRELGKKIDFVMKGQETELDRQVLDLIRDPLTHMVRNSADHGIENPADRLAAGKSETGTVTLEAFHEGGHIIIQISDDGKGLPVDKIRQKAIDSGALSREEVEQMSDLQAQQLIFHAGLSTAEQVTSVSGRGVGMDVVRTNIEKIGGTIELNSVQGKGSTFIIKIPLTLAIVSALIVEVATERYAVPQLSVRELVRVTDDGEHRIEYIKGTPVLRLRDRLLPLVSLTNLLNLEQTEKPRESYIIVTQIGSSSLGIIVDRVFDTEEIVVKPVSPILRHIDLFAGNTILGDGTVIMILDPGGIANAAGNTNVSEEDKDLLEESLSEGEKTSLLVFRAGSDAPKAVPLGLISRLEDFPVEQIEQLGDRFVVQYRGQLMPLVPFNKNVKIGGGDKKRQTVLVFSDHLRSMGIVVEEIIDIVDEFVSIETSTSREGVLGSAVIQGKATDIINVTAYLSQGHPDWFAISDTTDPFEQDLSKRVLLVDDSPFFRNMLIPLLTVAGYKVHAVESPLEAFDLLKKGEIFDVIVSDIEMPEMTGFEFAKTLRESSEDWSGTPMIALSSHATEEDYERGRSVGFNDYVAKFDKDDILDAVEKQLKKKSSKQEVEVV